MHCQTVFPAPQAKVSERALSGEAKDGRSALEFNETELPCCFPLGQV